MRALRNSSPSRPRPWLARLASAAIVAGSVGLTGLVLAPATAEAQHYYGGRPHFQYGGRPHFQPHYGPPPGFYRPPPPAYYRPPPAYYRPPPAYYAPPTYYAPPPAYYAPPSAYYRPPPPGFGFYVR